MMHTHDTEIQPGRSDQVKLIVMLGLLVAIAPLTIDMYLPALPSIATCWAPRPRQCSSPWLAHCRPRRRPARHRPDLGRGGPASPIIVGVGVHILASLFCPLRRTWRCSARCAWSRASAPRRPPWSRRPWCGTSSAPPDGGEGVLPADARHRRGPDPGPDPGQPGAAADRRGRAYSVRWPCWAWPSCCWPSSRCPRRFLPRAAPHRRSPGHHRRLRRRCCATGPSSGWCWWPGSGHGVDLRLRGRIVVRVPGAVRARHPAVRPAVRRRRGRADRGPASSTCGCSTATRRSRFWSSGSALSARSVRSPWWCSPPPVPAASPSRWSGRCCSSSRPVVSRCPTRRRWP